MAPAAATSKLLLLSDFVSGIHGSIPPSYIRPIADRPNLSAVDELSGASIPIFDMHDLAGPRRSEVVQAIGKACQTDGFFQIKNHGIDNEVIDCVLRAAREFFRLPEAERMEYYSDDPMKTTRLSTSFNVRTEKRRSWRDYLRLHCYPLEDFVHEWPSNPPIFREAVGEYCKKVREMVLQILETLSEDLGLEPDYMNRALGKHAQHMAINYYPQCPQPQLTFGLPGHKDPNALTILLQDGVAGLQVFQDGKWISVNPEPYNLVINVGDQMQALSNGKYRSILHRVVVNKNSERISIPTFYCPSLDVMIKPPELLIDEEHPRLYKNYTYAEYYEKFWNVGLNSESCLDLFKAIN